MMNMMERKVRLRQELERLREAMYQPQRLPLLLARMKREAALVAEQKALAA